MGDISPYGDSTRSAQGTTWALIAVGCSVPQPWSVQGRSEGRARCFPVPVAPVWGMHLHFGEPCSRLGTAGSGFGTAPCSVMAKCCEGGKCRRAVVGWILDTCNHVGLREKQPHGCGKCWCGCPQGPPNRKQSPTPSAASPPEGFGGEKGF